MVRSPVAPQFTYKPHSGRSPRARIPLIRGGSSTTSVHKSRTKRSLRAKRELGDLAAAAHLQSTDGTVFRDMVTTRGRVTAMSASSCGQALKQERVPELRLEPTQWCGVEGADQAARTIFVRFNVAYGAPAPREGVQPEDGGTLQGWGYIRVLPGRGYRLQSQFTCKPWVLPSRVPCNVFHIILRYLLVGLR